MNNYNNFPNFQVNFRDFLKGQNSYRDYPDGGFITDSIGANPFYRRGWLTTAPDQDVVGNIGSGYEVIAHGQGVIADSLVALVTDPTSGNGYFFKVAAANGAYTQVGAADATHDYVKGVSEAAFYKSKFYFTSTTSLVQTDIALTSPNFTYLGLSLNASYRHSLLVYGDILYIADGNTLHQVDNVTLQQNVLDLDVGYEIDSMVTYNNLIFIAAHQGDGFSKIYTWDGFSPSWLDEYEVDDIVYTLFVYQGVLFAFYKDAMGYFDGTKIKQIREISGIVYKHMVTKSRTAMYFIETINSSLTCITRYSPTVFQGKQINTFIRYLAQITGAHLWKSCVISTGQSLYGSGRTAAGVSQYSYLSGANINNPSLTKNYEIEFNERSFSSQVQLRQMIAIMEVNTENKIDWTYRNDKQFIETIGTSDGALPEIELRESFKDEFDFSATQIIAPIVRLYKGALLKSVRYFYQGVEDDVEEYIPQ